MERIQIADLSLQVETAGEGRPLLFLHGGDYFAQNRTFWSGWRSVGRF